MQEALGQANASGPKHPIICISMHWANLTHFSQWESSQREYFIQNFGEFYEEMKGQG